MKSFNTPPINAGEAVHVLAKTLGCELGGIAEHATVIAMITMPDGTQIRTDQITFGYSGRNVCVFVDASEGDKPELDPDKN